MLRFLTAGESHGPCLTAVVEGLPAGLSIDEGAINRELARRQVGYGRGQRMQIEKDEVELLGGVVRGRTTGAPVSMLIRNRDWENWRHAGTSGSLPRLTVPRPGHADYAGMIKYRLEDARPVRERASARETAARVAVGALAKQLLAAFGTSIGSFVSELGGVQAAIPDLTYAEVFALAESNDLRCPDQDAYEGMRDAVDAAREAGDTVGGVFVVAAVDVLAGLGSYVQWDRRLDARLAAAVMSIPGVKGVEIGPAFENARHRGTAVHDQLYSDGKGGVRRTTNRSGGTEGGISNGSPLEVRAAMKPIPTTLQPLHSVDLERGEAAETQYQRSDVCAVPSAAVVGEAMVAWVLAVEVGEKLGGDSLAEMTR